MFYKLCFYLLLALPVSSWAGDYAISKIESVLNWGSWSILLGSIAGGIASTFIKTEVDERLSHDVVAKLIIGTALGFFSCLSYLAYYPETVSLKLALPSFVLGCLGAPIIVFLLTWAADPNTFKKAEKKLNKNLGLDDEEEK